MESEPSASGPLPHFSVLKEEMSDNQFRVQQFLKGAFTYKVEERYTDKTVGDILVHKIKVVVVFIQSILELL